MYPFQNILFTTDFSAHSKSALKYAAAFARRHSAKLYIHNAQEATLPPHALKLSERALSENGYEWLTAVKLGLEELANSEILNGLEVQMVLSEGTPAKEIPRIIREFKIDLATMGTSARSTIGSNLGSTALTVMGQADCPLLLTRPAMHDFVFYKDAETGFALNRILFATDLSENDFSAQQIAIDLARAHQAKLLVNHSVGNFLSYLQSVSFGESTDVESRVRKGVADRLAQIAIAAGDVSTETIITEGRSHDETLRLATERDVDLIIIGTGRPRGTSALPGRNAERVVRGAPCPVLTVRQGTV